MSESTPVNQTEESSPAKELLFKVLVDGRSCHSGSLEWSLPVREQTGNGSEWKPGEWHEVAGPLDLCSNGLHLTKRPAKWFKDGCSIFVAEHEGEIVGEDGRDKIACRKVRLLRLANDDELAAVFVFFRDGECYPANNETVIVAKSSNVTVEGRGSSNVTVVGTREYCVLVDRRVTPPRVICGWDQPTSVIGSGDKSPSTVRGTP